MLAVLCVLAAGFAGPSSTKLALARRAHQPSCTMLFNADRSRRSAGISDRKVTLAKPLGLELVDGPGNSVIIADIIPGSNAAKAASRGLLSKGDCIVMCSATFGDAMWSTRGAGTDRVLKAIAVRAGDVSLVLETPESFKSNSKAAQLADEKARQVCTVLDRPPARPRRPASGSRAHTCAALAPMRPHALPPLHAPVSEQGDGDAVDAGYDQDGAEAKEGRPIWTLVSSTNARHDDSFSFVTVARTSGGDGDSDLERRLGEGSMAALSE
jgi:hypothetical protein